MPMLMLVVVVAAEVAAPVRNRVAPVTKASTCIFWYGPKISSTDAMTNERVGDTIMLSLELRVTMLHFRSLAAPEHRLLVWLTAPLCYACHYTILHRPRRENVSFSMETMR